MPARLKLVEKTGRRKKKEENHPAAPKQGTVDRESRPGRRQVLDVERFPSEEVGKRERSSQAMHCQRRRRGGDAHRRRSTDVD